MPQQPPAVPSPDLMTELFDELDKHQCWLCGRRPGQHTAECLLGKARAAQRAIASPKPDQTYTPFMEWYELEMVIKEAGGNAKTPRDIIAWCIGYINAGKYLDRAIASPPMAVLGDMREQDNPEKDRRVYYQDIVYHVCNALDRANGKRIPNGIVCGHFDNPTRQVQDAIDKLVTDYLALRATPAAEAGLSVDELWSKHGLRITLCGFPNPKWKLLHSGKGEYDTTERGKFDTHAAALAAAHEIAGAEAIRTAA